jgi:transposase
MAGRFEGLSDLEWRLCVDLMPPELTQRRRGMPQTPFRQVVHTRLDLLSTGGRWCDTPRGPRWAAKRAAQRGLQRWQADGTLAARQARGLGLAEARGLMPWEDGAVEGACSPGERWG